MFLRHPILSVVTLAYLGFVGWITLGPEPYDSGTSIWVWRALRFLRQQELTSWVTFSGIEFAANVLMFVPVGMFLVLLLGRRYWWISMAFGFTLSCAIELAQYYWIPTRVADVRDIVSNSAGTVLGVLVALIITWPKAHQIKRDRLRQRADSARARR